MEGGGSSTQDLSGADGLGLVMSNDTADSAHMQRFASTNDAAWWEGLAKYGITRAIDNRFGPAPMQGNVQNGSFAGQNGRTYQQQPNNRGGVPTQAQAQGVFGGINTTWLLVAAALAFFALR